MIPGKLAVMASMMKSGKKGRVVTVVVPLVAMRKQMNSFQYPSSTGGDKCIRRMNECYGRDPERTIVSYFR